MARKEISKIDYKFLVGRIEKIAGGQAEALINTQKKAVELLGAEIPQNVFDAADNRTAFNMWLGSEINPIINSDGYKEEIRVFGDGYDFFEVKADITACLDDYFVNSDDAAEVEIENEINNRLAEDKKRQDFIKSVLNMGDLDSNKEIKLIGQDADGGETLTARNVAFNGFDYHKMCDGLYHVRIIPQGHETFSTLASYETEGQAQEVIKMLGAAIQRGDETFSFATVEGKKFEVGRWYYDLFDSKKRPAYKVTRRTKKMVTLIDEFGEIIKRKVRIDLGVEEIHIGGYNSLDETELKANRFCTNADEIQEAEDDLAYSLGQDVAEVEEVNAVAEKIAEIKNRPRKSVVDWTDAIFQNVTLPVIFKAQKFLKKYLKLGQLDLAENIFAMLKTLCRNYRAA